MLAAARFRFLLSFLLAFSVAACLPAQAQINGVPASVTSLGFGGSTGARGVPPSVTSLRPNGYGNSFSYLGECCSSFFWPVSPNPGRISGRRHHRKDHTDFTVGVSEPVYIPYAVPYGPETDDDPAEDNSASHSGPHGAGTSMQRSRNFVEKTDDFVEPEEPVIAQLSTVLVFKDGHQSDVENYAIVGDALFDFEAGRTHKANDDRGVDFQIPASATR